MLTVKNRNKKGSVLIVTLMILSLILVASLSVSLVAIRERKAAIGEGRSNRVFQAADTGVEDVMHDLLKTGKTSVNQLNNCQGSSGKIIDPPRNRYTVELRDISGNPIACDSLQNIRNVTRLKSVSNFGGDSRAIMASVVFP